MDITYIHIFTTYVPSLRNYIAISLNTTAHLAYFLPSAIIPPLPPTPLFLFSSLLHYHYPSHCKLFFHVTIWHWQRHSGREMLIAHVCHNCNTYTYKYILERLYGRWQVASSVFFFCFLFCHTFWVCLWHFVCLPKINEWLLKMTLCSCCLSSSLYFLYWQQFPMTAIHWGTWKYAKINEHDYRREYSHSHLNCKIYMYVYLHLYVCAQAKWVVKEVGINPRIYFIIFSLLKFKYIKSIFVTLCPRPVLLRKGGGFGAK